MGFFVDFLWIFRGIFVGFLWNFSGGFHEQILLVKFCFPELLQKFFLIFVAAKIFLSIIRQPKFRLIKCDCHVISQYFDVKMSKKTHNILTTFCLFFKKHLLKNLVYLTTNYETRNYLLCFLIASNVQFPAFLDTQYQLIRTKYKF